MKNNDIPTIIPPNASHSYLQEIIGLFDFTAHKINSPLQCITLNNEHVMAKLYMLFELLDLCLQKLDYKAATMLEERSAFLTRVLENCDFENLRGECIAACVDNKKAIRQISDFLSQMCAVAEPAQERE